MQYLIDYKKRIEAGTDVIGRWMLLNIQYIERGLENKSFYFDQKKADKAINFIERFCHHVEGKTDLIVLEPWQKYFIACMFGIVGQDGLRQFREIVLVMGRKQGKSLIAAALEVYTAYMAKEAGMQIYNLAPKLDQANIIFNVAAEMIRKVPSLDKRMRKRRTDMYFPQWNATLKPIAFNSKKSDGFNPYWVTYDEFAAWPGPQGKAMYDVMMSAQGARDEPLNFACSTANYEHEGLYDELILRSTNLLLGTSEEKRLLPFIYMIDDVKKWDDMQELRKAMPNLGISVKPSFIENEIKKARASQSYKREFLTKYANIQQISSAAWLTMEDIKKSRCEVLLPSKFYGMYGVGGVDLSQTTDLTAAAIVIQVDGIDYCLCQFFMPKDLIKQRAEEEHFDYEKFVELGYLTPSGTKAINYEDVVDWFVKMQKEYRIYCCVVGYDRYNAQFYVDEMRKRGFVMDDVIQGTNLTPIIDEFGARIAEGKIKSGTNGLLQSHFANVALEHTANDKRVRAKKIDQRKHIDGFAAVIDAMTVRQKYNNNYGYRFYNNKWKEEDKK